LFFQWDHRNGSGLTEWLASEYIGGKEFGLGNPNISVSSVLLLRLLRCYKTFHRHHLLLFWKGFFIDDNWGDINDQWNHGIAPSEEAWPVSPRGTGANRTAGQCWHVS